LINLVKENLSIFLFTTSSTRSGFSLIKTFSQVTSLLSKEP